MTPRFGVVALIGLTACGAKKEAPAPAPGDAAAVVARGPALTVDGAWTAEQAAPLLAKTQTVELAPDLSHLTAGERAAVDKLLAVGAILHELYQDQRHVDAPAARALLAGLDGSERSQQLRALFHLFNGPIANTLDNQRVPFLAVRPAAPGKMVYPWAIAAAEIDGVLAAHPERRAALLAPRTVVRRADEAAVAADLAALTRHPVLDTLHPGLRAELEALRGTPGVLYAVPYSVAYADRLVRAYGLLAEAAAAVAGDDAELAGYLRNRGRDLLSDDYESGDAAWVTADFKNLNAQIGSYETYDDELHGAKTFFSTSILVLREDETAAVRKALTGLQAFEDSLPLPTHKKVRDQIPVGVYDVVADFGQARGGNTASILPNEAYIARRYGRTILMRANIIRDPDSRGDVDRSWRAAVSPAHAGELTGDGDFHRTLWHELGHYLGVDSADDGRSLGDAADLLEEMKADLVSLFIADALRAQGYYDAAGLRAVQAAGVRRVLQNNKPRRDQPYQTMQLMQWNFFLEKGLLRFEPATQTLAIDYRRYHAVVGELLAQVLAIQAKADKAAADAFITKHTTWDDALHGVIAQRIREQQQYRFRLFRYAALPGV
jgi:hypothetical protein